MVKTGRRGLGLGRPVAVRFEPDVLEALEKAALVEEREVSQYVRVIVKRHLKREGLWSPKDAPGPRLSDNDSNSS